MIAFIITLAIAVILVEKFIDRKPKKSIKNRHVVITGGSSGIGKCVAKLAVEDGAHVTIIARDSARLELAVQELKKSSLRVGQKVQGISLDVTNFKMVKSEFDDIEEKIGPIYMLVNCAGLAICGELEAMPHEDINTIINTNLLGTIYPTKVAIGKMKDRKNGIIVITASQAALLGVYGLSIYSASKFALRGFAEALNMEVFGYNVSVTVGLPPDTDTPGFHLENKTKPVETCQICNSAGIYKPETVAQNLLNDALNEVFFSTVGAESYFMSILCAGMTKCRSVSDLIIQVALMGPLRIVGILFVEYFYHVVKRCWKG